MADNEKDGPDSLSPEERLSKVLESRWDPSKINRFMQGGGTKGQRLDMTQRSRFEKRLGVDLGDVRIFSGDLAEEITRAHNAEALTIGDTGMILMRQSSAFSPGSSAGTALLAHELTHVAQARPLTVSRKKTSADLAEEDASEEEAEGVEGQVLAEEKGQHKFPKSQADKDEDERARRDRIRERVMEIMEEEQWMQTLRMGAVDNH